MICLAKPNRESDNDFSSDDELIGEPKMNGMLNHSLRADGSIDLNNSVTARVRRRKTNESVCIIIKLKLKVHINYRIRFTF